jgi:hypothetical protein
MIVEATLAVTVGLTVDDVIHSVHPFPTVSEGVKHTCRAFRPDTTTMSWCVEWPQNDPAQVLPPTTAAFLQAVIDTGKAGSRCNR